MCRRYASFYACGHQRPGSAYIVPRQPQDCKDAVNRVKDGPPGTILTRCMTGTGNTLPDGPRDSKACHREPCRFRILTQNGWYCCQCHGQNPPAGPGAICGCQTWYPPAAQRPPSETRTCEHRACLVACQQAYV